MPRRRPLARASSLDYRLTLARELLAQLVWDRWGQRFHLRYERRYAAAVMSLSNCRVVILESAFPFPCDTGTVYEGYFTERTTPERRRDLGPAELANLRWVSHGLTTRMVADVRNVSPETVKDQLDHARQKLAAKNTTHAIAIAIRLRLIA